MVKYVFGLYWRTVLYTLLLSFVLTPVWYFLNSENMVVVRKSLIYLVYGIVILLPVSKGRGILYLLNGRKLSLGDMSWIRYRKVIGFLYLIFSIVTYMVYLYLPIYLWVNLVVFGGIFMLWFLPAIVAVLLLSRDS